LSDYYGDRDTLGVAKQHLGSFSLARRGSALIRQFFKRGPWPVARSPIPGGSPGGSCHDHRLHKDCNAAWGAKTRFHVSILPIRSTSLIWRFSRRRAFNSARSLACRPGATLAVDSTDAAARLTQLRMLVSWQANSLASPPGFLPAATSSTICWRNCGNRASWGCGCNSSGLLLDLTIWGPSNRVNSTPDVVLIGALRFSKYLCCAVFCKKGQHKRLLKA
jgi:hypothetical protein